MDPVRLAFTTVMRPAFSANNAMMISVAFPKVALRRPPMPAPMSFPSSSVATPMRYARGMMAIPAAAKRAAGGPPANRRMRLMGTGTRAMATSIRESRRATVPEAKSGS